ncbi:helix-turn-helix domain-containing protein [Phenylobacterium sp.]|jgi:AraC family transcriptional activator of pobA|uniref:helix-turn-helix domain-containing protein n=1 Tax=Phenylobacterium sp. TaxID=1871053 RepID=UPI002E2EC2C6|nr:helix-turn-helix domain-containing protein [Phenylobacterium sp.]HEX2560767.1 helix-turn-helix domain-containing protein [Phenylobacterium sp.]
MNQLVDASTFADAASAELDPIHLESLAAHLRARGPRMGLHRYRDLQQLTWLARGEGACELDGRTVPLKGPVLVAAPPGVVPHFELSSGAEGLVVLAVGAALGELVPAEDLAALARPLVISPPEGAAGQMAAAFGFLQGEFARGEAGRRSGLRAGYLRIVSLIARAAEDVSEGRLSADAELVARFRALVEQRYREHEPLEAYGQALGVSLARLSRACRRATGKAPLALVHERVMLEARRGLTFGAMSVSELAGSLGFADAAYFSRFFQKRMGVAPSAFRDGRRRG